MATTDLTVTEAEGWVAVPLGTKAFTLNSAGKVFYAQASASEDLAGVTGARMVHYMPYLIDTYVQYFVRAVGSTAIFSLEA